MLIPRQLKIPANKDKQGFYKVRIGATLVGEVEKNRGFNFIPGAALIEAGIEPFKEVTMRAVKEKLTEVISRDLYMSFYENPNGLPIED